MTDLARIEELIARVERLDPAAQAEVRELLAGVLDLHRDALARIVEMLGGAGMLDGLARDPAVSAVLLLHDLHPLGLAERARAAVDRARSQLAVEGCAVELTSVDDGVVRVHLERAAAGHRASAEELRTSLRDAILAEAPDAADVLIEGQLASGRNEAPLVQIRAASGRP